MGRGRQLPLFAPKAKWRGRKKRGRKVSAERVGCVKHRARPAHDIRHPVHVTIRRVRLAPSFRTERVRAVILAELVRARRKAVRVVEYSIQDDHLHLMVEGSSAADLSAQMRKLFSRIAMMVNQVSHRRGSLFRDRHHRHALSTPSEVRTTLVYVLFNARKHITRGDARTVQALHDAPDPFSSAPWFEGWAEEARPPPEVIEETRRGMARAPVTAPQTWLAQIGWQRAGGRIRFDEAPRPSLHTR